MVTLKTFDTDIEASIVKGMLESEGIPATIHAGKIIPYLSFFSSGKGVRLKVEEGDLARAQQLIKNDNSE